MPTATRTFRVFVSSTFEDLKAERDALQREVFPRLRKLCEENGARFQAIDLRWGVRDEATLDQQTMVICLREIERCQRTGIKPNFIVLLGERYGWRPLPARIQAIEFAAVRARIADPAAQQLAAEWYERDDNAVPAEFVLKPRTGEWADANCWQELELRLHRILLDAARAAGLAEEALLKYWASATHREILKGLGTTEMDRRHVFAFSRNVPDSACDADLASLKKFLRAQLPIRNILTYEPGCLAELCQQVEQKLSAIIEGEAACFESRPALELEIEAHDAFARERSLVFGRDRILDEIDGYLRKGGNRPLVLRGASGCGKSAILALASERARSAFPSAVVVRRFIGVSPESSNGLMLLRSLCVQIGAEYGATGEIPIELNGAARVFSDRLALATAERPLVVFLDALDQLGKDDPARSLIWLSGAVSAHCRMVLSTTELAPALSECEQREIEPLREADAGMALDRWLAEAHRTLTPEQRWHLHAHFSRCGLPLYLKLAFEEARGWPSSLPPADCLLGEGVEGIVATLLARLSLESNHGPLLVSRGLGYLAAARYGLTEDEMLDVLSEDEQVWQDFLSRAHHTPPQRRLPVIVWSRLFLDLEPYVAERSAPGGTVASFYHRQLAEHVAGRFLAAGEGLLRHQSLAQHFGARASWLNEQKGLPNARKVAELPWQLLTIAKMSAKWDPLEQLLTNLSFLEAKACADMIFDLANDFRQALRFMPRSHSGHDVIEVMGGSIGLHAQVLHDYIHEHPQLLFQNLWNDGYCSVAGIEPTQASSQGGTPVLNTLEQWRSQFEARNFGNGWIKLLQPVIGTGGRENVQAAVLAHQSFVTAVCVDEAGKFCVSASKERNLIVWDLRENRKIDELVGHHAGVESVAMTPDGRTAVSAGKDLSIRFWDVASGRSLCAKEIQGSTPDDVAITPDGTTAITISSREHVIRVWHLDGELDGTCKMPDKRSTDEGGRLSNGNYIVDFTYNYL